MLNLGTTMLAKSSFEWQFTTVRAYISVNARDRHFGEKRRLEEDKQQEGRYSKDAESLDPSGS